MMPDRPAMPAAAMPSANKEADTIVIILGDMIVTPLFQATEMLADALLVAQSRLERTGAIQCFEYCYELTWKTLRRVLDRRGVEVNSPRETFRAAALEALIDDPEIWFDFVKKRNLTVHTYSEQVADEVYASLPAFTRELRKLLAVLQALQQ